MKTHVYKLAAGSVLILLLGFNLHAQEYEYIPLVKPGVQIWTTVVGAGVGHGHYNRFALTEEDTIMEGENYKKLYWFTDSVFNPLTAECIGGLRENNQKQVFYKGKRGYDYEVWFNGMICDFSLSVGDTVDFQPLFAEMRDIIVQNIDTIDFGGIKRKVLKVGPFHGEWEWQYIEGVGSDLGLLCAIEAFVTIGDAYTSGKLRCYEHNGELQYMAEDITDCGNPYAGLFDVSTENNTVTVAPNPAGDKVKISSEGVIHTVEVFNALGQKVYRTEVKAKEKTLDVHSLSKGIYIIGVNTEDGYVNKKLVKE